MQGYEVLTWMAMLVPVASPAPIRGTVEAAMAASLRNGDLPRETERAGFPPRFLDGAATRAFIEAERARYRDLIRAAGITADGG